MIHIKKIGKLVFSIILVNILGSIGAIFTTPSIPTWYATINKPSFNPPNWVFAPAWTLLFTLIGISLFLVWEKGFKTRESRIAISIFGVQLFFNVLWSVLFFGLKSPGYAFAEILVLWIFILLNIILFYRISKKAGLLLIPYICWVSFAALLNYYVWILNI